MSRFLIEWRTAKDNWIVWDKRDETEVASFDSLLEAETYVIERTERSER